MKHLIQKNIIAPDKKRLINETIIERYLKDNWTYTKELSLIGSIIIDLELKKANLSVIG